MLIKNARFVLTPERILEKENVVVEGNRISSIGGSDKKGDVIDASNYAVIPGLVNMHTHSSMSLFRGISDDKKLQNWLQEDIWPLEENLTGDICYAGSLLAFLEMIKTGTTCLSDMYFYADRIAEAAEEIGIRGFLGPAVIDLFDEEKREEGIKETRSTTKKLEKGFGDRIQPTVAPHSAETCSEELFVELKKIADEGNMPFQMHLAETEKEVEKIQGERDMTPVEYLDSIGILDEKFVGAHGVHLTENDMRILSKRNSTVVYSPCSNMKLASGAAPVWDMFKENINVCMGTDGAASNNNLDLLEEAKIGSLLQKLRYSDPRVLPVKDSVKMITSNAADALGTKLGMIKEGYLADIVLVDLDSFEMYPMHSLRSNLIYSGASVDIVMVGGEIVLRNGRPTKVNEEKILKEAENAAEDLTS